MSLAPHSDEIPSIRYPQIPRALPLALQDLCDRRHVSETQNVRLLAKSSQHTITHATGLFFPAVLYQRGGSRITLVRPPIASHTVSTTTSRRVRGSDVHRLKVTRRAHQICGRYRPFSRTMGQEPGIPARPNAQNVSTCAPLDAYTHCSPRARLSDQTDPSLAACTDPAPPPTGRGSAHTAPLRHPFVNSRIHTAASCAHLRHPQL